MAEKIVRVRMPDGSIKRVRVDADQTGEVTPEPLARQERVLSNPLVTGISHALAGGAFQFGDEALGALGALGGKDYKESRDSVREFLQEGKSKNPRSALIGEITGGLATGVAGALKTAGVKAGTKTLEAIPKLMRVGAGEGGAYAFGASKSDDPEDQARDTLTGVGFGALFGGGTPAATRGAKYAFRNLFPALGKDATGRSISKILDAAGETEGSINAKVAKGENLTPSDVSPALQQLMRFASTIDSPARSKGLANIGMRLSAQKQKVLDKLTRKQAQDADSVIQQYKGNLEKSMKTAYADAYKHTVKVGGKSYDALMRRPAVRDALREAMDNYATRHGKRPLNKEGDRLPVEVLDKVSGVLGDAARVAREAGENSKMVPLNAAKKAWDNWLEKNGPESLLEGRKMAHKGFLFEDAVRKGQDYLKTSSQGITDDLVRFKGNSDLLKGYRAGVVDAVGKKLARIKDGTSFEKAFTPAEKKRLKQIMGKRFDSFWAELKKEGKIAKTDKVVRGSPHIEGVPSVLQTPVSEVNLLGRMIQQASRFGQRKPAMKRREELVNLLTDPRGLKGIPTAEMIHAIGRHRLGVGAGVVPQMGEEPYP